jgi:iron complex outermembrane receptor protein
MKLLKLGVSLFLVVVLNLFSSPIVSAQGVIGKKLPLRTVLQKLSDQYRVNFLYEENAINNKRIVFIDDTVSGGKKIEEVITGILYPIALGWTKIDAKNYSVFPVQPVQQQVKQQLVTAKNGTGTIANLQQSLRFFQPGWQTLKEVKIITSSPILQRKNDRYVLNVEKSIIGEGTKVSDLVEQLPGVQIDKDGKVMVNGRTGVSIFIDGKPTLLTLDGILSSSIERIELISNPSARYESAGSGGIINMVRRKNRKDGLNGSVTGGYGRGRFDRFNGNLNIGYKNERFNLYINQSAMAEKTYLNADAVSSFYSGRQKSGTLDAINGHVRNKETLLPDVGLELYLSPTTALTLSGNGQIRNDRQRSDSFTAILDENQQNIGNLGFVNMEKTPVRNYSSSAHFVHQLDTNGKEVTADVDYSIYNNLSSQAITNTAFNSNGGFLEQELIYLDQQNRLNIYAAKADYVHPFKNKATVEAGIKSSYVSSKSTSDFFNLINGLHIANLSASNNFRYQENINAVYVLYSGIAAKLNYQAGLRIEHTDGRGNQLLTGQLFNRRYTSLFPSLSISYRLDDKNELRISSGRKIDRPAYQDLNPLLNFVNSTAYIQGDPNLKPQMAYNNEIGYSYNQTLFFTLGNSFYSDYITYWVFGETDLNNKETVVVVSRPVNIARAAAYNANALIVKKLRPWWTTSTNFTIYYSNYNGVINGYPIQNQGMVSFLLSSNHIMGITDRLSAEANYRYAGKSQIGTSIYRPNSNLSLGLKMLMLAQRGSITLHVTDLFHHQNYRWTSQTGQIVESRDVWIDSRVFKINFAYRFGRSSAKKVNTGNGSDEEKNRATTH